MRRAGAQLGIDRDLFRGFAHGDVVGQHQAGFDRGLRLGAALEQTALDQQAIDASFFRQWEPFDVKRAQASFTVSASASLPSASNTLMTMPLASRPALAYIAAGES